jgi:hypothetical protein
VTSNPYESPTHCEEPSRWPVAQKMICLKGVQISCACCALLGGVSHLLSWHFMGNCCLAASLAVSYMALQVQVGILLKERQT